MRALKYTSLLGALGLALSGCGGGGDTATSTITPPPPVSQSEYEIQTKAAREQFEARLAAALSEAENWMEANRREDGIVTTQSGLQYRIDKATPNPSGQSYGTDQTVIVHYEGKLTDGTVFDSSFNRGAPERLKPEELIAGWQEALKLMKPGDEWTIFIPPALGYGELGKGRAIPANAVLIFKVRLR